MSSVIISSRFIREGLIQLKTFSPLALDATALKALTAKIVDQKAGERSMHHYRKNIGDYHKKAGRLSILQHGVYNLLIDACYDRERFPTREEAIDWCWASTPEEINAVDFVLAKFFVLRDSAYVQTRIEEEILAYRAFCEEQAEKGKRGGRPKKANGEENKPDGFCLEPDGNPAETQRGENKTLTNNQLTANQEPTKTPTANPPESGKPDPCPHQAIVDLYHEVLPQLARVRDITEKRKTALRARWRQNQRFQNLDWWRKYFSAVAVDDFLMGRLPGRQWQADFDFLLRPDKFQKIIEGGYQRGGE